jgi:CubicO group peptidase (beta-lactamase class C family)
MKAISLLRHSCAVLAAVLALGTLAITAQQAAPAIDMSPVKPESAGFSSERLERLHAAIQAEVDKKQVAGAVTLLARHGKIVEYRTYGMRDLAAGTPITKDTIFRDYSMTKPVTGVAMMILYEEGKWNPADPISKYIPEFKNLKVFNGFDANGKMVLADPIHPPTMRELMTHSAGFSYGSADTPVDKMWGDLKVRQAKTLQEEIELLAKIPLLYQPGTRWVYSTSMDIQGHIGHASALGNETARNCLCRPR